MTWDWLVQRTGKYCSIRRMENPEFQTRIFGRMESAPDLRSFIFLLLYGSASEVRVHMNVVPCSTMNTNGGT